MKATPTISIHLLLPCSGLKGRNTTPGAKTFWDPIFVSSFLKKHKIEKGNGMNAVAAGYTTLRLILKDVLSIMLYHDKLACARQDINSVKNWKSKRISCLAAEVHYGLRWWDVGPKGLAWNQSQKPPQYYLEIDCSIPKLLYCFQPPKNFYREKSWYVKMLVLQQPIFMCTGSSGTIRVKQQEKAFRLTAYFMP